MHAGIAGGIRHKYFAVLLNDRRSLIYPEAVALPVVIRRCQKNLHGIQRVAVLHSGDVKIGYLPADSHFFRPDVIPASFYLEDGRIQGKCLNREFVSICTGHLAFFHPRIMYRVITLAFQHIRADRPDVVLIAAGIV